MAICKDEGSSGPETPCSNKKSARIISPSLFPPPPPPPPRLISLLFIRVSICLSSDPVLGARAKDEAPTLRLK